MIKGPEQSGPFFAAAAQPPASPAQLRNNSNRNCMNIERHVRVLPATATIAAVAGSPQQMTRLCQRLDRLPRLSVDIRFHKKGALQAADPPS